MMDPIIRTDTDASLGVVVHLCTTNHTFHNRLPLPDTRSPPQPHLQLIRQTTRLESFPLPDRPMFVGVLCVQPAPSRICECHRSSATRSTTGRGQSRESQYAPETFVQFPPPSLASLRLRRARQTRRVRRTGKQSPAERVDHTRDERVLRSDILRALRLRLLRLLRLWPLLLLRPRWLSSPRPC